MLDMLNLKRCL